MLVWLTCRKCFSASVDPAMEACPAQLDVEAQLSASQVCQVTLQEVGVRSKTSSVDIFSSHSNVFAWL